MDFFLNKKIFLNFNVQWRFFLIVNVKWGIAPIAANKFIATGGNFSHRPIAIFIFSFPHTFNPFVIAAIISARNQKCY